MGVGRSCVYVCESAIEAACSRFWRSGAWERQLAGWQVLPYLHLVGEK